MKKGSTSIKYVIHGTVVTEEWVCSSNESIRGFAPFSRNEKKEKGEMPRRIFFGIMMMLLMAIVLTTLLKPTAMATDVEPLSPSIVVIHSVDKTTGLHIPNAYIRIYDSSDILVWYGQTSEYGITGDITTLEDYEWHTATARKSQWYGVEEFYTQPGHQDVYVRMTVLQVGGIFIPADKLGLLAPYVGAVSTILFATVATSIYVKRA